MSTIRSGSSGKPGVKAMERVINKAPNVKGKSAAGAKPKEYAMKSQVNPVPGKGKGGANPANVGGSDFHEKRNSIRSKKN